MFLVIFNFHCRFCYHVPLLSLSTFHLLFGFNVCLSHPIRTSIYIYLVLVSIVFPYNSSFLTRPFLSHLISSYFVLLYYILLFICTPFIFVTSSSFSFFSFNSPFPCYYIFFTSFSSAYHFFHAKKDVPVITPFFSSFSSVLSFFHLSLPSPIKRPTFFFSFYSIFC